MLVKQLSVFMENRPGRLYKLTHALGQEGIDFVTLSIADTKDYGIVRFIARDNDRAYEILKQAGFTVGQTELIGVEVEDKPNALAEVIALLEDCLLYTSTARAIFAPSQTRSAPAAAPRSRWGASRGVRTICSSCAASTCFLRRSRRRS